MKIHLSPNTAGRSGGKLNGNLRYFSEFIEIELKKAKFKTSFEELWLNFAYPPMYVLPGVIGMEITFKKYYDSFPYSRLNRKNKKIEITLKAPEFSEHFDKEDQKEYEHKFDIDPSFKNISETELGKIVVEKFLEAGEIINSKIKKEDIFEYQIFKNVLNEIKQNIDSNFLNKINTNQKVKVANNTLERALDLREKRKNESKPKDKLIRDLRIYYNSLPLKALYPYDYIYTEIFHNLLTREKLMCPTYHHLYIQVATNMEDALKNSFSIEDWYVNGLALIEFDEFQTLKETEKKQVVFDLFVTGLKDIATIDKLDITKIDNVINHIKEKDFDTELLYKTVENNKYTLKITYFSKSLEEECPIFFNITDKQTNNITRKQIGTAENTQIHLWLQNVSLTNEKIKIKSSDSIRGQVYLKDKPTIMEFLIEELMK
ncbi:hypothetical protein [Flavobacterium sp.]|uniref:hypothetical protein n=1 Tax=Flavobacterium sp. TaxID=239 RepID=UPI00286BA4BF|nr:hypothetical protein [Flavobacterium sp.]